MERYRKDISDHDDYGPTYRSPREQELEAIVVDRNCSFQERKRAEDELLRIIETRTARQDQKELRRVGGDSDAVRYSRFGRVQLGRACSKHGIRGCSECSRRRRNRKKPPSPGLRKRFETFARDEAYEPDVLAAPAKRGRASSTESARLDALGRVIVCLYDNGKGDTLEVIGSVIGRDRKKTSELHKRGLASLKERAA